MYVQFISFFKSFSFFKGLLKTIAVLLPIGMGWYFDCLHVGIPVGMSVIVISPSDIPGNRKHHIGGLLIATFLAMVSSFCINLTHPYLYLLLPTMLVLTFFNAYISLYGHRASMIAISGLFSIASTLSHIQTGAGIYLYLLYILVGGLWYVSLVLIYLWLRPRQYSEQLLGKCFSLTADFFAVRADLLLSEKRDERIRKMIDLQTQLNEHYEKLREEILDSRSKSGKTNYLQRQFLMFIELVDIFELALANPVQYEKIENDFITRKDLLTVYAEFLDEFSNELQQMSVYIGSRKKIKLANSLKKILVRAKLQNESFASQLRDQADRERLLTLRNFYDYIENQYKVLENIRVIFENYYHSDSDKRDETIYRKFVSVQNYSLKRLKDHFTIDSSFFRHAIRLSLTILIGYIIGILFPLENPYWIIFTIFIIMRPGFGLTKDRSTKRIYGTLLGGIVAFTVMYLMPNPSLYLIIGIFSMPIAFALMQDNYMFASVFITISIVLLYALIAPDAYAVIHDRVLDTAIGAGLAFTANYLVLPTWEQRTYHEVVIKSIRANIGYLQQVKSIFNNGVGVTHSYKIARKEAFLALSNLNATFQRMLQEPKFKKNSVPFYEIIVIQQSFLTSVASLGIRLQNRKGIFPKDIFNTVIDELMTSLSKIESDLRQKEEQINKKDTSLNSLQMLEETFKEAIKIDDDSKQEEKKSISMRESHLYREQFSYLFSLVTKLEESIKGTFLKSKQ